MFITVLLVLALGMRAEVVTTAEITNAVSTCVVLAILGVNPPPADLLEPMLLLAVFPLADAGIFQTTETHCCEVIAFGL